MKKIVLCLLLALPSWAAPTERPDFAKVNDSVVEAAPYLEKARRELQS